MQITIRDIGNRKCVVLRKPAKSVREGWAEAAAKVAAADGDSLLMGEFGNVGDAKLAW